MCFWTLLGAHGHGVSAGQVWTIQDASQASEMSHAPGGVSLLFFLLSPGSSCILKESKGDSSIHDGSIKGSSRDALTLKNDFMDIICKLP